MHVIQKYAYTKLTRSYSWRPMAHTRTIPKAGSLTRKTFVIRMLITSVFVTICTKEAVSSWFQKGYTYLLTYVQFFYADMHFMHFFIIWTNIIVVGVPDIIKFILHKKAAFCFFRSFFTLFS